MVRMGTTRDQEFLWIANTLLRRVEPCFVVGAGTPTHAAVRDWSGAVVMVSRRILCRDLVSARVAAGMDRIRK